MYSLSIEQAITENPIDSYTCFGETAAFTCSAPTLIFWSINGAPVEEYPLYVSYTTEPGWQSTLYIAVVNETSDFDIQCRTRAHGVLVFSNRAQIHSK